MALFISFRVISIFRILKNSSQKQFTSSFITQHDAPNARSPTSMRLRRGTNH